MRDSAVRTLLASLAALGCASGLPGFGESDPMHGELERLEREQRRMAEQVRLADEAERADRPPSFESRLARGDARLASGAIGEALWEYAAAHRLEPGAPEPRVRLGFVHLRHQPERARPLFESALEVEPGYASAHTGLGLALLAGGERREGLRHLERAVELAPRSADASAALGVALDRLGRSEDGLAHLERARELRPRDPRILNNLGVAYLRTGAAERAEGLLRAALRQDTRDEPLRRNNLGMAVALQGRFAEALALFRQAGDEQAAQNNLGYAHHVRGEYAQAIAAYEHALVAGGPESVEVVRNLHAARDALRAVRAGADARTVPAGALAVEAPGIPDLEVQAPDGGRS